LVSLENNTSKIKELSKRHRSYWEKRVSGKWEESYKFELPYQRFIHSFEWYKDFYRGDDKNHSVIQTKIIMKNPSYAIVETRHIKEKNVYYSYDKWFYIDGKWFHKMKTTYLPIIGND